VRDQSLDINAKWPMPMTQIPKSGSSCASGTISYKKWKVPVVETRSMRRPRLSGWSEIA